MLSSGLKCFQDELEDEVRQDLRKMLSVDLGIEVARLAQVISFHVAIRLRALKLGVEREHSRAKLWI